MTHSGDTTATPAEQALAVLSTRRLGQTIRSFDVVSSTNELALQWAADGAPDGAVVYAEYQERGRGRMGRTWSAAAGLNLMFSVILRPSLVPDQWSLITIAACVAVADAVEAFTAPVRPEIKWPNDVLLEGRKCCGMLLESNWSGRQATEGRAVVMGIGINVNQDSFPTELQPRATSLLLATGQPIPRAELLAAVLEELESALDHLRSDASGLRRRYLRRMRDLHETVELRFAQGGGTVRGIAAGLGETGGLILSTDEGMRIFHAGEVTRSH